MAETQPRAVAYPGLFRATYYVDPGFTGLQAGSEANPFTTCAAAFAAAIALGLSNALIFAAPVTLTENITLPSTGGNWEIATQSTATNAPVNTSARINGTVTLDNSALTTFRFSNIRILGAVSGAITGSVGTNLFLNNVSLGSTLTLTGTNWQVVCNGAGTSVSQLAGTTQGATTISGALYADAWSFIGAISTTLTSSLVNCRVPAAFTVDGTAGSNILTLLECNFAGATTLTGVSTASVRMDGASVASAWINGLTLAGTLDGTNVKTFNANASNTTTIANNVASTPLGGRAVAGLYEILFDMTLLTAGTFGTMQLNAIYTDMTGTLVTVPVGGAGGQLVVTAALGTKASGVLQFQHNGAAAAIAFSVTGVVTPGALSVALSVAVRRAS